MAAKDPRSSPVRSETSAKANKQSQEFVRQPSLWHLIRRPKTFVPVVWIVFSVLLLAGVFLYFITKSWPILDQEDKFKRAKNRQVVVILIPGMRWDTFDTVPEGELRGFRPFFSGGVRVSRVTPVFPSYPLPSWTTLQTGLYPEQHGILGDAMFDCEALKKFDERDASVKDARWWQQSEPIWVTATKQGKRVATLEWNNADVPFNGELPEVARGYRASSTPFDQRMEEVTELLRKEFNLIMVAYDGLENATLCCGPFSTEVRQELRNVAVGLHLLFSFVHRTRRQLDAQVVVVSDRGYETACPARAPLPPRPLYLETLRVWRADVMRAVPDRRLLLVYAWPGTGPRLLSRLAAQPGYKALLREDIPDEFYYKRGKWAPDILMYPLVWNRTQCPHRPSKIGFGQIDIRKKKWNFEPTAPTLLMGWGSGFKSNRAMYPPIRLVDVYQVMTHLLGVNARPHNGSWSKVSPFLVPWELQE